MNYCFHCMAKLEKSGGVCPECGYDNRMNTNGIGFLPGCVLNDQYVIGEALGRGGFGITYMGLDLRLNRKVAVKEYFPMSIAVRDPASMTLHPVDKSVMEDFDHGIERVMREAGLAASLDDIPNIVRIHNVIQANGTVYIIMEYIKGMTLSQYVQKEGGKLTWLQVWTLLQPVMRALGKIHSLGVVHRDVSPDNIMIREDGTPILLDFGAAQHATTGKTAHSVALRLGFAPLEQFSTNGFQDGRTDQYSMMATMYYALTGHVPNTPMEGEVVLPREYGADIPEKAEKVLMKGMSRNYQDRYPNMEALMDAFEQASSNEYTKLLEEKPSTDSSRNQSKRQNAVSSSGTASAFRQKSEVQAKGAGSTSDNHRGGKGRKAIWMAAGIAALVFLGVLAGRFFWQGPGHEGTVDLSQNAEIYASALEYMASGQYEEAIVLLDWLGDYEGAARQKEIATKAVEERRLASAYAEAQKLEKAGKYDEAEKAYAELGPYSDSAEQAVNMQKHLNLQKADDLMAEGQYEAAIELYSTLGDFAYAEKQKKLAEIILGENSQATAYVEAHKLEQAGKYAEAGKAYEALGTYMDASDQTASMQKYMRLQEADDLMDQGHYEEAQKLYESLAGFTNAERQARYAQKYIAADSNAAGYMEAHGLEQEGKYAEAERAYAALGSYMDAADQAVRMQKYASLIKANSFMEQGQYEEAIEVYASLGSFETAQEQKTLAEEALQERRNAAAYEQAQALEKAGKYEEAQKAYAALGTYRDAEEKAESLSREKQIELYKTVGSIVTFGHYEQDSDTANGTEAIEWMVLDVQDGKALLVSRYGLEGKAYHNKRGAITWEESDLRKWLNSEFMKTAFTEKEQSAILTSLVANGVEQGYWKTNGGNDTQDQIFLLSYAEANRYLGVNGNANEQAQCVATMYAQSQGALTDADSKCRWWLRSSGHIRNNAACVSYAGSRRDDYISNTNTVVRPAFWLDLESDIF